MNRVLIVGIDSFTGKHLSKYLENSGFIVYGTALNSRDTNIFKCNITNKEEIKEVLKKVAPNFIINLAAISFVAHSNMQDFYSINTIGTLNILDSVLELNITPKKVILASSATVYGNQSVEVLYENLCPNPTNHYGTSKLSMEQLSKNYFSKLPIIITRPFNYTGVGQTDNFLIPKIVKHFREKKKSIELGNLDVIREFNDIDFVCEVYKRLLKINKNSEIVNICSGRGIRLLDVIDMMQLIAGYEIEVKVNPKFVRKNEIKKLIGSKEKLFSIIGKVEQQDFKNTLNKMFINEKI